jgi:hypothetical protein
MKKRKCDMCGVTTTVESKDKALEDRYWEMFWSTTIDVDTGETLTICSNCKKALSHSDKDSILEY